ncbi:hypothetical protein H8B09_19225 [Paenibacillus sp. PR3]|uniref:DUF5050 domain-containing protein n=1 Tax=Paenibacillus terricola TaxID=2763503 RepID=A0ABR8MY94_9BACL|nr:hypothetical protein [Paenibacillus terricola]MBD3920906.1 hypothetical protein [Paenibacillus terricola]
MMFGSKTMQRSITVTALLALVSLLAAASVMAAVTYVAKDRVTAYTVPASAAKATDRMTGGTSQIVWVEKDKSGAQQVMWLNVKTGKKMAVSVGSAAKSSPKASDSYIAWLDKGSYAADSVLWDVKAYDIKANKVILLNSAVGPFTNISISGRHIVWSRTDTNEMYLYNFDDPWDYMFGLGRFPVVGSGKIVYKDEFGESLSIYDVASDKSSTLYTPSKGKYVNWFVFNGTTVLWKQRESGNNNSGYVMLPVKSGAKARALTDPSVKKTESSIMFIGATRGAWAENMNGKLVMRGVNLSTGEVYTIGNIGAGKTYLGFNGDDIVLQDSAKGTISLRTMARKG